MADHGKYKVLFVCLGNSCRSPMAETIFKSLADNNKWQTDSAALADWNVGLLPNPRAEAILNKYNLSSDHIARQIQEQDFHEFDYIFGMDNSNVNALYRLAPENSKAKIYLLGEFHSDKTKIIIRDPYFDTGSEGFDLCYQQCLECCQNFLKQFQN